MLRAKTIDDIYQEVKDYDMVICNDAPLALALNNRLDEPKVGTFALTPRQLAGMFSTEILGRPMKGEIEAVKDVSRVTGYKMRFVHGEIENIKRIWRYKSDVKKYLHGRKAKTVFDEYYELPTLEKAMSLFYDRAEDVYKRSTGARKRLLEKNNVAVIGRELFDELDKNVASYYYATDIEILPGFEDYELNNKRVDERLKKDGIEILRSKDIIGKVRELSNEREIADNVIDLIDKDNAQDIAIVMDVGGRIADSIRSALYRKKIPFKNELNVRDLNDIRDFIEFLNMSHNFPNVKISQVRELISTYHGWVPSKYDKYLAEEYSKTCTHERTKFLFEVMKKISAITNGDSDIVYTYDMIYKDVAAPNGQIRTLLKEMEIDGNNVSLSDTEDLVYAVNNFNDLKHNVELSDFEKGGVLLVDCKNSVYIDRPVIFYLGLGSEWERDLSDLNLIEYSLKDTVIRQNVIKFQILLQQGQPGYRFYIVSSFHNGRKVKPCEYFVNGDRMESTYETFSEIDEPVKGSWFKYDSKGDSCEYGGASLIGHKYEPIIMSNSTFKDFVSCPRSYMFNSLVSAPENDSILLGSLLHQYAEFRICYPDEAARYGREHYVNIIADKTLGLFTPDIRNLKKSNIRCAIMNIDQFIEKMRISDGVVNDVPKDKRKENIFIDEIGKGEFGSQKTEVAITCREDNMEGILDVLDEHTGRSNIYDFKTGRPKGINDIVKSMDYEEISFKDFQCLFYLALLGRKSPGNNRFTLFFAKENGEKITLGKGYEITENIRTIRVVEDKETYIRNEFVDTFLSAPTYEKARGNRSALINALLSIDIENKSAVHSDQSFSIISAAIGSKSKSVINGIQNALCKLSGKEIIFDGRKMKNEIVVTEKALDDLRTKVNEVFEQILAMYKTDFPATPKIKCEDCGFKDLCTAEVITGGDFDEEGAQ